MPSEGPYLSLSVKGVGLAAGSSTTPEGLLANLPGEARRLKRLGASALEFWTDALAADEALRAPDLWRRAAGILRAEGLAATVHLPMAWVDLTSLDREVWEGGCRSVERVTEAVAPLGPALAAVHPSNHATRAFFAGGAEGDRPRLAAALGERLATALRRLARGPLGAVLALENLEGMPLDPFLSVVEFAGAGVCLDVGHALAENHDPIALLRRVARRLVGMHLHDATAAGPDGRAEAHRPLGEGRLDLDGLVEAMLDARFAGPVVLEMSGDETASARAFLEAVRRLAATGDEGARAGQGPGRPTGT